MSRFATDDPAHRRIVAQAFGIVHIIVTGEAAEHRLTQQSAIDQIKSTPEFSWTERWGRNFSFLSTACGISLKNPGQIAAHLSKVILGVTARAGMGFQQRYVGQGERITVSAAPVCTENLICVDGMIESPKLTQ
jgi:hypothetical protein